MIRCGSEISDDDLAGIAQQISAIPGVIEAHVVKGPNYNIIVRFTHLKKLHTNPGRLQEEIQKIKVRGKCAHEPINFWIIYHTFQKGEEVKEEDERAKRE
jgi:DNA-binding Lrp family transcriptional regulator